MNIALIIGITSQYLLNSFLITYLQKGKQKKRFLIPIAFIMSLIQLFLYGKIGIFVVAFNYLSLLILFYLTSTNKRTVLLTVSLGLITAILGDYFSNMLTLLFQKETTTGSSTNNLLIHLGLGYLISFLLVILIKRSILPKIKSDRIFSMGLIASFVLMAYYIFIITTDRFEYDRKILILESMFFVIFAIFAVITGYFYERSVNSHYHSVVHDKELELQEKYISSLEKNLFDLRSFKHDYRSLLYTLDLYISDGDLDALRVYYDEKIAPSKNKLRDSSINLSKLEKLNPKEIRSLITIKVLEAYERDIEPSILIPEALTIPANTLFEVVESINILFDNALDEMSAAGFKEDLLLELISLSNNGITITLKNPTREKPPLFQLRKQGFSTKKTKNDVRGMGLYKLDQIVNQNPALSLETKIEEGYFTQKLYIQGGIVK